MINLDSSFLHLRVVSSTILNLGSTVGEFTLWTNELTESIVPDSAVITWSNEYTWLHWSMIPMRRHCWWVHSFWCCCRPIIMSTWLKMVCISRWNKMNILSNNWHRLNGWAVICNLNTTWAVLISTNRAIIECGLIKLHPLINEVLELPEIPTC